MSLSAKLTPPSPARAGGSCCSPERPRILATGAAQIALVGNPNAGKTTLFNALTGIRAKTANFPGTTIEIRLGPLRGAHTPLTLVDLPGLYSLKAAAAEERVALDQILGRTPGHPGPDAIILLLDACNLTRNLYLASQVLQMGLPVVVALTMVDVAEARGMKLDLAALAAELGCRVIPVTARTGRGVREIAEIAQELATPGTPPVRPPEALAGLATHGTEPQRYDWAEAVCEKCLTEPGATTRRAVETADRFLTHPIWGVVCYLAIMVVVFYLIFAVAQTPMDWIDGAVGWLGEFVTRTMPAGDLRNLLTGGIIAGVGGVLVFLPQICLIFFCLTLLEDVGYMARAALVMDRLMRRVGLPGKAFVPMLSAHACAIPAIMATRMIEDRRDRLVTILILPLLTCSARLPVYAMVTALLFPQSALKAALVFIGAYGLGLMSAVVMAFVFRRTILPGQTQPLVIELPDFRRPSMKLALMTMLDRARLFLGKAGTIILAISIVLWWLSAYPKTDPAQFSAPARAEIAQQRAQAATLAAAGQTEQAEAAAAEADHLAESEGLAHSYIGRIGHWVEPVLRPLGFDWRIGVGVVSSFAAREVVVSTLAILYGRGGSGEGDSGLYDRMRAAKRADGTPIFTFATCMSLVVFFVLAMQCASTLAIIKRETGQWRWVFLQQGYMTVLAYGGAFVVYQTLVAMGLGG